MRMARSYASVRPASNVAELGTTGGTPPLSASSPRLRFSDKVVLQPDPIPCTASHDRYHPISGLTPFADIRRERRSKSSCTAGDARSGKQAYDPRAADGEVNTSPEGIAAVRPYFCDRAHAGQALARALRPFVRELDVTVLGLARGGVPVARQVADALDAPLGVMVSGKIGVPGIEEVALGAVAEGSDQVVADSVAWYIGVPPRLVDRLAARKRVEVERRAHMYRAGQPLPAVRGRTVVLVDDGLSSGATLRAAAFAIRKLRPRRVIAAVPIASLAGAAQVRPDVDQLIAMITPKRFETLSTWYHDYAPVSDEEVLFQLGRPTRVAIMNGRRVFSEILRDVGDRIAPALLRDDHGRDASEQSIAIPGFGGTLLADFGTAQRVAGNAAPVEKARGLVILANGGGSSRHSYRNRYLAGRLRLSGYATLRVDLLTGEEEQSDSAHEIRFDVARIAGRLTTVCEWAARTGVDGAHRTILMGSSTAAAAALGTAARRPERVSAVIGRAGRVELAAGLLRHVTAPVLLVVGGADRGTMQRNADAMRSLPRGALLVRVARAGHLFSEPGALGAVAEHSVKWLDRLEHQAREGRLRRA